MKVCTKCKQKKPLSEFYQCWAKGGRHYASCKQCQKDYANNRNDNKKREDLQSYLQNKKEVNKRQRKNNPFNHRRRNNEYNKKFPQKAKARLLILTAIRSGNIIKPDKCTICDRKAKLTGHHEDYNKPLEVVWICASCHNYIHKGVLNVSECCW